MFSQMTFLIKLEMFISGINSRNQLNIFIYSLNVINYYLIHVVLSSPAYRKGLMHVELIDE